MRILDAGDTALTIEFGDAVNRRLLAEVASLDAALARAMRRGDLPGVVETVPTFRSLTVIYDPLLKRRVDVEAGVRASARTGRRDGFERDAAGIDAFPDLQGFGRRVMQIPAAELEAMLIYQFGALAGIAGAEGGCLTHVRPHGALNNQACVDAAIAAGVVAAIKTFDRTLILLAPARSELVLAGAKTGLRVALEVFADRAYTDVGQLVPRSQPGAVLHAADACVTHVRRMLDAGGIVSVGGRLIPTPFHSVCVHGDGAQTVVAATAIRAAVLAAGISLQPLPEFL